MTTQLENEVDINGLDEVSHRCTCAHVRRASRLLTQLYDDALRAGGLTSGQFVLLTAINSRGSETMGNIANVVAQEQSAFSRNLKLLETKGLVRTTTGSDRRTRWISLTTLGQHRLEEAYPLWRDLQDRLDAAYGPDRMHELIRSLEALQEVEVNTL
ncbi:MAG: MarR family winged helix-turn-helix transcriptional regulator [Opitutales bacterium]